MNVGYSSTDAKQIQRQISDMISRGIDGVIVDWYGPNNGIDDASKLVMAEAEAHPGFTFAIMVDQGAIQWNSCFGCSPQQALISQLQYVEQTYFPSPAYMTLQGRPVITNFNIDLSYSVNWDEVSAALSSQPAFLFQNNDGFGHILSAGSYSWVMPTTTDHGLGYLKSFYDAGMAHWNEQTVGATYKGFDDTLAAWGTNRVMGQQCGQTWLQTFSEINGIYSSAKQLSALQLVTWNDYEEGTEIESGIANCVSVSASASDNSLKWTIQGKESTIDHYVAFASSDGNNLMSLGEANPGTGSLNLCNYSLANGNYTLYVQAVGKPSMTNQMSAGVKVNLSCSSDSALTLGASPSAMTIASGSSGKLTVSVTPQSGSFNSAVALTCSGLPSSLKCSFAPASVIPGTSAATSLLTVTANSAVAAGSHSEGDYLFFADWVTGCGLFGAVLMGKIDRRRASQMLGACFVAVAMIGAISCGGNNATASQNSGAPNSYAVTINGNAGSIQLSTTVTITVK